MKKTLLFMLILPVLVNAQTSGFFPLEIGNAWYFNDPSNPAIQVIADTSIQGRPYKKLHQEAFYVPYPQDFFLRVDSGKVYLYYVAEAYEALLYDFSANAGDTLVHRPNGGFLDCYDDTVVPYAGRMLRRWGFASGVKNCPDCSSGEAVVDSIGWSEFWSPNYSYQLSKVVIAGQTIITGIPALKRSMPDQFDASVYPNPFNSSAILRYSIPHSANLRIALFNSLGQQVRLILDRYSKAGEFSLTIDGTALSSGVYYCRLIFDDMVEVKKIVLLK